VRFEGGSEFMTTFDSGITTREKQEGIGQRQLS
jgi:hypothetical protein